MKTMERLALASQLEVKFAQSDTESAMSFTGYGAVFGNQDQKADIIAPGAFTKTLAEHKAGGTVPLMFFNHDSRAMPIGLWTELEEDETGLKATGAFLETAAGRDAYTAVKAGAMSGLSIGFYVTDFSIANGVRTITEVKLVEISVVNDPCNTLARIADVKAAPEDLSDDDFRAALLDLGVAEEDAEALVAKRNESADIEEIELDEEKSDGDSDEDEETKYNEAAFEAVETLIRKLKQESYGR